ncbi:hypothetical protein SCA6_007188 [Theobroma cacao]
MAVCDVSGSMSGISMEVSVALGVLVSELSEEPWKGKLITFSKNPKLQKVESQNLKEKTCFVRGMAWGMNTDFQKVSDLILKVAVRGQLKPEQTIKRTTPVPGSQNGVALVSGFSKNLIKMLLDEDGDINPEAVMEAAISGEEYQKLVVLD